MKRAEPNGLWRFHRDQRGQAIFLGMFYFFLLAGLVFLVLNSGKKSNDKIGMQNTADAVATTGATWVARGLNTAAMCNVTQTQMLSVIVLLDTMEVVAPVAQRIIDDLLANIGSSAHGSDVQNNPVLKDWLIVGNARAEQEMIREINSLVLDLPIDEYCLYDSGVLWQCCYVLNEMKTQMAEIAPTMAQREAINVGDKNDAEAAFVIPFHPDLPIEPIDNSGNSFSKFRRPMRDARRVYSRRRTIVGYRDLQGYASRRNGRTLGPFRYMREPFTEPTPMGLFELSRFSALFKVVSDKKFEMLFGAANQKVCLAPDSRIEDYDELVKHVNENGRDSVLRTYWSVQGFSSRYEYNTPRFEDNIDLRHRKYPRERLRIYKGYRPAPNGYKRATTPGEGADPRHDLWYRSQERQTGHFPALGIYADHPPPYTESEMVTFYRNRLWRFDGADVGHEEELHRLYLPPVGHPPKMAPIVLHRQYGRWTTANIRDFFTIVGFAFTDARSIVWPQVFPNPVPTDDKLVCYAQAEVFASGCERNLDDRGWDLFTQNWRVRLVRMDHWDWCKETLDQGIPSGAGLAQERLGEDIITPVRKMLEMYRAEHVDLITH